MSFLRDALQPPWLRRYPFWLKVLALLALPYVAWLCTYPKPTPLSRAFELGYLQVLSLFTPWIFWRASRRTDYSPGFQSALRWMAGGWALNFIAGSTLPLMAVSGTGTAPSWLTDSLYLLTYPVFFLALAHLTRASEQSAGRARLLLDGAVFVVGVGTPLWLFGIHPTFAHGPNLKSFLAAAYPAMAFLGVMGLNLVLLRYAPHPSRPAHYLLLVGLGLSWLGDLLFSLEINGGATLINLKYWGNIVNALALLCNLLSAWRMLTDTLPVRPTRPMAVSPGPIVAMVIVGLWMVKLVGRGMDAYMLQRVLVGIILLILVIVAREALSLRESMKRGAEAATSAMQARFEALVRHSSDPILVTDAMGQITFADPAALRATGLDVDTLEGQDLLSLIHPDDASRSREFIRTLTQHPEVPPVQSIRLGPPGGPWRLLEISGCNLLADPAVQGLVLNARDITERHRLQNQLREAQKMEAMGRLAGGVAHDFNNILGAIMGSLGLAESSLPQDHPAHRDLVRIQGAATRGAALTGRLLAFCRREIPELKVVNPETLLHGLVPMLTGLLGEHILFHLEIESDVGAITVDPNGLEQALLNLAANARDAMPDGGSLVIRLMKGAGDQAPSSSFLDAASNDTVTIEVTDSGEGMDEETQQHLFEPFFTTKGRGRGTGLGLASVYGMVSASRGGITVRSNLGQGTTIRLTFPRTRAIPEEHGAAASESLVRGTETILLVEDEPSLRETTQRILEDQGYTVLSAADTRDALAKLQAHPHGIHLLLTDVIMPGQSGPSFASQLVQTHPELRVLYISGYTANELDHHDLARPDAPLLRKPFTVPQLARKLREVFSGPPGLV